jgi:hypothetical protein
MNTWFRNHVENAVALIDMCGSVEAAREVARMNAMNVSEHNDSEFWYWIAVRDSLADQRLPPQNAT